MGMFDYVRCEQPLPDGWKQENDAVGLQTKDFNCEMVTHVITADGRLLLECVDSVETVPKEERPYPDAEEGTLQAICGSMRFNKSIHESDFHGWVHFGGLETVGKDDKGYPKYKDHSYRAKFTDGRLVEIIVDE